VPTPICVQQYRCTNLLNVANGSNLLLPSFGCKGKNPNMGVAAILATFTRTLEKILVNVVGITH